jgi:hypothetical protein
VAVVLGVFYLTHSPPPLQHCSPDEIRHLTDLLPMYRPTDMVGYVVLNDNYFEVDGRSYFVRGVNYYPARYPWRRFFTMDRNEVDFELDLLREAGFNTLRVFLWYVPLFQCEANGAVPEHPAFLAFDSFIHVAAERGFRLIVTLHDEPDLTDYPLYTNPSHTRAQTTYILNRYREERAILAWDIRNEGDIDYGSRDVFGGGFFRDDVLAWGASTSALIHQYAPHHLITAGWMTYAEDTAPFVDFISFHHWWDAADLSRRIVELRRKTDKPILLQEVGYSSLTRSLVEQHDSLRQTLATAEEERLLGWMIWAAFDFPRDATCYPAPCLSPDNMEHYFGLWTVDYLPKPVINALPD